ncbi:MAG: TolC family protein [Verrucomicrobiota bacterium JB022]|nr:TolC family protein [Verrucomicrobiota bacterium JB022]
MIAQSSGSSFEAPVTLQQALDLAVENDPALKRLEVLDEAAAGQVEQASLRPNPTIGAEVENFLGTGGGLSGVDGLEITLGVSQVLEMGGKRQRRTALAEHERALLGWDAEQRLTMLQGQVRQAFVEVLLAQRAVELRREQLALATESRDETSRLVEAARAPEVDRARAQLAVRQQQFALQQAEREAVTTREALSALWGLVPASDFTLAGEIAVENPPDLIGLVGQLADTPALARFRAEASTRQAALELEEARATPDIELTAGARYFNENSGDAAFLVGVQVPWPLFDRNQGNIRTARAQLRAVEHEQETVRRELLQALAAAHRSLVNAYEEVQALENELRPAAEQALADTQSGYERGQFTILSVLDSRQALFEVREAQLDALRRYAQALAQVEALTRPVNPIR